ncbi:3'-5' exonuclease [Mycolicibacterium sphagni]|uniref:3'-5' exonuclease n=2 Tax=Mycolicibacterium sphagni TaxID=1786 RepID=A0ABX2JRW7_9MYCO|nr:3'-5' exonuclease [Mycolicibacterium sphagni]
MVLRRRGSTKDLDRPWRENDYAVVDLETTGLDLRRDTIASYGIAPICGGRMLVADQTYGLVRPESPLSPQSITVHALRPADLVQAPPLSQAIAAVEAALRNRVLIAHVAWVEHAFLTRAFAQHGKRFKYRIIDTAALARAAGLDAARGCGEPDLETLATELRLPVVSPHHALGDAITTGYVFFALAAQLGRRGYRTARDFIDLTEVDGCRRR